MTIPALSTSDKHFICSYNIGSNVDFRPAMGIISEITTYTTEYVDGFCYIPVYSPQETNDHSHYRELVDKDEIYVKVGVRSSADGYIHTWLMDDQPVSELILWNNSQSNHNDAVNDTTVLHWVIEKVYRMIYGNTTGFISANIKFQQYTGGTYLQMFGNNSVPGNSSSIVYTSGTMSAAGITWYPNNASIPIGDILYAADYTAAGFTWINLWSQIKYDRIDTGSGRVHEAINAGTTGLTEPTWNTTIGSITTDGSVSWRCCSTAWAGQYTFARNPVDGWWNFITHSVEPWATEPDATTPEFWLEDESHRTILMAIDKHCVPGPYPFKSYDQCNHDIVSVVGLPSGRSYTAWQTWGTDGCDMFPSVPNSTGWVPGSPGGHIDEGENAAYIWVPGYCEGASGGNQTECEANGGTWVPGHYACDPSFTYDSSVLITYKGYSSVTPNQIDYVAGKAHFGPLNGAEVNAFYRYGSQRVIDSFSGIAGDVDELRSFILTPSEYSSGLIQCRYTDHVGVGVMGTALTTILNSDWVVSWGANDYFNGWSAPDGLSARNPGTSQTVLEGIIVHHGTFNTPTTQLEEIQRYWEYDNVQSTDISFRNVDKETKPILDSRYGFSYDWRQYLNPSDSLLARTIGEEIKQTISTMRGEAFNWRWEMEMPWVAKHRFLKTDGNNALDGKNWARAWKTATHAVATVYDDARLHIKDGVYPNETDPAPKGNTQWHICDTNEEDILPATVRIDMVE